MLTKLFDALDRVLIAIAGVVLVAVAVLINVEVVGRTFFAWSTQMSDEYSGYGLCATTMLCLVVAMRRDRFLRVDGIVERLPPRGQAAAAIFGAAIGAAVSAVLCWSTAKLTLTSFVFGTTSIEFSQTPLAIPQSLMPIGFGLLCLGFLETAWRHSAVLRGTPAGALGPRRIDP
jgi:TRAP-type C4-dicarboxylate transport system permease small subunit